MIDIYLALPYTGKEQRSFIISNYVAGELMLRGKSVYAPISHCHEIAKLHKLPTDFEFWKKQDEIFIGVCQELHVIQLEGWDVSVGVQAEIKIAEESCKEVKYWSVGTRSESDHIEMYNDTNEIILIPSHYLF